MTFPNPLYTMFWVLFVVPSFVIRYNGRTAVGARRVRPSRKAVAKKAKHEEAGKRGRLESQAKFKTKSEAKASLVRAAKDNIYLLQ